MRTTRFWISFYMLSMLLFACLVTVKNTQAAERLVVRKLKDLCLTTSLVENRIPRTVIVAPTGGRNDVAVAFVQARLSALSGVTLPVYRDDVVPEELLRKRNVIALGNMATNAFIERLYRQWQVILDLKYPGPGGYVVRTLHNPFGTGHNVIFIGGSDDAGVAEAARVFTDGLKGNSTALSVGWLMKIRLGKGMTPPVIGAYLRNWDVHSWSDTRRKAADGGYDPATYFGWNPISISGALYYMTGKKEYLQTFKELAMPDPQRVPIPNRTDDAFNDPLNPLVKNYHYRSHRVDFIYDLIEESPLLTDKERLVITNKLLDHQYELDPNHIYYQPNGDRHTLYHMLCIYTGSRYFSTYYPDPVWVQRIKNVRKAYASFISNPTWGERDTLEWVITSTEPVFEFFLLDGFDEFVKSGTARTMIKALEIMTTGDNWEDYLGLMPINLLYKATYMLNDTRYLWLANRLRFDLGVFRIGQSYLISEDNEIPPPVDMNGKVTVFPLARTDRESSKTPVSAAEAFQLLSYRTGWNKSDDYLLLDGFEGLGRHPYQLATILKLRMFQGMNVLSGYANDLTIRYNGMAEPHVARSAALKTEFATDGIAYIQTEVPDMPASRWQRHVLYLKDWGVVVVDRIIPNKPGRFDINHYWQMGSTILSARKPSRRLVAGNGAVIVSADEPLERISDMITKGSVSRELGADEPITLASLLHNSASPKAISPLGQGAYLVTGTQMAFAGIGPFHKPEMAAQSEFTYIDKERLFLVGATQLSIQGTIVFSSDKPVTVLWRLREDMVTISASQASRVRFPKAVQQRDDVIPAGEQVVFPIVPSVDYTEFIGSMLTGIETVISARETIPSRETLRVIDWNPAWEVDIKGKITAMAFGGHTASGDLWAVSQGKQTATIVKINSLGELGATVQQDGEVLSLWPAKDSIQSEAFSVLVGFRDDMVRAFSENGRELWNFKAIIHPSFIVGDRYDAPWFTDPGPQWKMTGVYSILVGDLWGRGREEIAIGRPSTVEFHSLDGSLNGRTPTRWGNNTSLAVLKGPVAAGQGPMLLAGKAFTGIPQLSGISKEYKNTSDFLFGDIAPGFTDMHAWEQRGLSGLQAVDINGDGDEEVVYTLSGHWNELRVYDGSGKPLWMKFFGPDKYREKAPFMSALEVVDLYGDGKKEIMIGTKEGWICAFDHRGTPLWQRRFPAAVTSMAASASQRRLAVGCADGSLFLLNAGGATLATGNMDAAVLKVIMESEKVFIGDAMGRVRMYLSQGQ